MSRVASGREPSPRAVAYGSAAGRWVLLAAVLGSALAFLDATVVNIALPSIGADLGAGTAGLQWTVNGYTLSVASLVLLGGSLGDSFGRRRIFVLGVVAFAVASLLCALAPNIATLVAARVAQGVGAALLTPGALAVLQTSFDPADRARAIGAWSGLGGIAGAAGPLLGGWLVEMGSWRLVFLINLPLAAVVVVVALHHVPESRDTGPARRPDVPGALTAIAGLAGVTYWLTASPALGATNVSVVLAMAVGVAGLLAFVLVERGTRAPMLPLSLFRSRAFTAANLVTFAVYGALGGVFFLLPLYLQVVAAWTPLAAGTALLPVTALMLLLSARAGTLADRVGPRLPMTAGPIVCAGALLPLGAMGSHPSYVQSVLPGVLALGAGLSLTVAPLTATALGSVEERHAGVASGVNNAVARAAGLLAVAGLPLASGLGGGTLTDASALVPVYRRAMLLCTALLGAAAGVAFSLMPRIAGGRRERASPARRAARPRPLRVHCAVGAPPLQPGDGSGEPRRRGPEGGPT